MKNKRSYTGTLLPHKFCSQSAKSTSVITRNVADSSEKDEDKTNEMYHIFRPGIVPPFRQCYYQVCYQVGHPQSF